MASVFTSGKFWLLAGLGVVLGSCLFCGGGMGLLMFMSPAAPVAVPVTPGPVPTDVRPGGVAGEPVEGSGGDGFVFVGADGLTYVPELTVAARGVDVKLVGRWRDDKRGFELVLGSDGMYRCEETGSAGNSAAGTVETGQWTWAAGEKLHLVPARLTVHAIVGMHQTTEEGKVGGARDMAVEGLTLEYVPMGVADKRVRRVEGLAVEGEVPAWSYAVAGRWKWVLRRAG